MQERTVLRQKKAAGGDLFELETVREYAKDYKACTEEAADEKKANARPALKKLPDSIEEYDVCSQFCLMNKFAEYLDISNSDRGDTEYFNVERV